MATSLAGKYKLVFRTHSGGQFFEPGSVVDLSHEDAEALLALKGAERAPESPLEAAPESPPKPNDAAPDATPAPGAPTPPPKGDRKQK